MNPERNKYFIEAENCQRTETGSFANGDVCMSRRTDDGRTLLVLTHGRGSGIQANVTASVISSMIVSYAQHNAPIGQAAQSVLNTFGGRGSQTDASFAVADIHPDGTVAVAEYETPPFLLFRQGTPDEEEDIPGEQLTITAGNGRKHTLRLSRSNARPEDRILIFTKGVIRSCISPAVRVAKCVRVTYDTTVLFDEMSNGGGIACDMENAVRMNAD